MLDLLAQTGRLPEGANVNDLNPEFASAETLSEFFGSAEAAADWLNRYACTLEDQKVALIQRMQEIHGDVQKAIQLAQYYQAKEAELVDWITEPANVAAYYLELEKMAGEIDVDTIMQERQQINEIKAQRGRNPMMGGMGVNPAMANYSQAMGVQPTVNSATAAAQYSQMAQSRLLPQVQRPVGPEMMNQNPTPSSFQELMESVPISQRYKVVDQLTAQGAFRGGRISIG